MYANENMNDKRYEEGVNRDGWSETEKTENERVEAERTEQEKTTPYFDYTAKPLDESSMKHQNDRVNKKDRKKREKKEKSSGGSSTFKKLVICAGMGICFGVFAGATFFGIQYGAKAILGKSEAPVVQEETDSNKVQLPYTPSETPTANYVTYVQGDISDMVEEVMPAMVSIVNNYTTTVSGFWGQSYQEPGVSSGSGIIVGETDEELLIATNNHVVEGTDKLEITFIDGSVAEAVTKGTDADMDLAVVAVAIKDLSDETKGEITVATLGDSDNLKLGEPVVAIGNALGYGQSVTNGIVSALDREITASDGTNGCFIQTNAAINPGNSGGALLNIEGEVIGINSSKIGGSTIEGMGYAIPISSASPILSDLMNRETRTKVDPDEMGYMGITMQAVTAEAAEAFGFPKGVYIREVESGSAADKAGILKGDIIVKFDGQRIVSATDLQDTLQYFRAGETAVVTVKRAVGGGEFDTLELEITLGTRK